MNEKQEKVAFSIAHLEALYSDSLTIESLRELKNIAFYSSRTGPDIFIIGGWAAWRYHRGIGSRDIDIVFHDRRTLEHFLHKYFRENGFEIFGNPFNARYRKPIASGERTVYIEIDAASFDEDRPFKEDSAIRLPFSELDDHFDVWVIEDSLVKIPCPELLLLQKIKALRDRTWDLVHIARSSQDIAYLNSKILKDEYDIRGIYPFIRDWDLLWSIARRNKCHRFIEDSLRSSGLEMKV